MQTLIANTTTRTATFSSPFNWYRFTSDGHGGILVTDIHGAGGIVDVIGATTLQIGGTLYSVSSLLAASTSTSGSTTTTSTGTTSGVTTSGTSLLGTAGNDPLPVTRAITSVNGGA